MTIDQLKTHLKRTKPTQEDFDNAERVLQWLSDHAYAYPQEYWAEAAQLLTRAANACHVYVNDLVTNETHAEDNTLHATTPSEPDSAYLYTAYDKETNARMALGYYNRHPHMTIYAGRRGGYAVSPDDQAMFFNEPSWHQTSPEEVEAYITNR